MSANYKKLCIVPNCPNGNAFTINKNKIFVTVPRRSDVRSRWCKALRIPYSSRGYAFCCEDHFDLENDAENWMHFKLMGRRLILKKNVLPRLNFINNCDTQFQLSDREAKENLLKVFSEEKPMPCEFIDTGDSSSAAALLFDESEEIVAEEVTETPIKIEKLLPPPKRPLIPKAIKRTKTLRRTLPVVQQRDHQPRTLPVVQQRDHQPRFHRPNILRKRIKKVVKPNEQCLNTIDQGNKQSDDGPNISLIPLDVLIHED